MSLAAAAVTAAVPGAIPAPSIEYSQLAPMLVVFGAAVVGVLVEAFAPARAAPPDPPAGDVRGAGRRVRLDLRDRRLARRSSRHGSAGHAAAEGAVAVDRPTLFIQGTILVLAAWRCC